MRVAIRTFLLVGALTLTIAASADSGPSLHGLDRRERAHYRNTTRQLRILTQLQQTGPTHTVEFATMTGQPNSAGSMFYTGTIYCPPDTFATGGGTDWTGAQPRGDWVVNYSAPSIDGTAWSAGVFTGDQKPNVPPRVFAVCVGA